MIVMITFAILCQAANGEDVLDIEADKVARDVTDNLLKAASERVSNRMENAKKGNFNIRQKWGLMKVKYGSQYFFMIVQRVRQRLETYQWRLATNQQKCVSIAYYYS